MGYFNRFGVPDETGKMVTGDETNDLHTMPSIIGIDVSIISFDCAWSSNGGDDPPL